MNTETQQSKPCERCAELEQRMHKLALDWQVKENKLAALEAENARLTKERNEAVNAVQRLSEGQPFEAVVIADAIKRATAQHEQTIAQQAERIKELEGEIDKERQRGWDGNAESSRELAELTKQLAVALKERK